MELAHDRRSKLDITKDKLQDATAGTMWPITYCVNHSNISIQANWNYAILTKLSFRNCDFMIRNLVVLQKKNPIVKWEDDPSGLKDDWTLYYRSLMSNDVYKVVHPFYKQLDEMECAHLQKRQRDGDSLASEYDHDPSSSDEDNSAKDNDSKDEDYCDADEDNAAKDTDSKDEDDCNADHNDEPRGHSPSRPPFSYDDASADEDRVFGPDEYPFTIPRCYHEFSMTDRCNVPRRLHKEYQTSAKSASIVAVNYWYPLGEYRQWGEYLLYVLT